MIKYDYIKCNNSEKLVVLIHGWNTSSIYMESFINPLKSHFNIINIDLFNQNDEEYTIEKYVDEIHQIISKFNSKEVVFISHSFGGKISYFYGLKHPVKALILLAPSLIKPRFNLRKFLKIKLYKLFKLIRWKVPYFLQGSRDYQNAKGAMKKTFINCHKRYINKKELLNSILLVIGFNHDQEVKPYQIKKIKKYQKTAEIIIFHGNHFSYLDYIKEICLKVYDIFK